MTGNIRLDCMHCDRDEYDGGDAFPSDWDDIEEVRSHEEATREVAVDDRTRSVFDWQTHLGVCPPCRKIHGD